MDSATRCCIFMCTGPTFTAVDSATSAFNTWVGGLILQSAGWAPAAVSHLPAVGAIGSATITGPILCCVGACLAVSDGNLQYSAEDNTRNTFRLAFSGAVYGATGAAILGWGGAKLGFAAAAGAIGGVVGTAVLYVGAVGAVCICGTVFACCDNLNTGERFYIRTPHPITFNSPITAQDIQAGHRQYGRLTADEIVSGLNQHGLSDDANAFKSIDAGFNFINNSSIPQMK